MLELKYDAAVIGGGAAGLAAAKSAAEAGLRTVIIEREPHLGGILTQCIHTGFGLKRYSEELTGPEYAERDIALLPSENIDILTNTTVLDMQLSENGLKTLFAASAEKGMIRIDADAVILAMGCRERNRGNIGIPGSRPAGVMTAGFAQRLLNIEGCVPGGRAVVIGSGDIGLIMARRLAWAGAKTLAVVEILPWPSGLARNIAQCLDDFGIPLMLSHAVTKIIGKERVEAVEIAPLENGAPDMSNAFTLDCDTVLLSAGLLPDNELSKKAGVKLSPVTGGPVVDASLMTNIPGIFAAGNVLHVHDLVDNVSWEGEKCGAAAADYIKRRGAPLPSSAGEIHAGENLRYVCPSRHPARGTGRIHTRALAPFQRASLTVSIGGQTVKTVRLRHVKPSEMISVDIDAAETGPFLKNSPNKDMIISLTGE
jgi:NADPH-dependent 2,4-dienoyl-CoA reductase/sulfur reductase-like enzyme